MDLDEWKKMIICFEGPSAIGKTTLSYAFANEYYIVSEVNQLYNRKEENSRHWYVEMQSERFKKCLASDKPTILDGDIFQPIWYNWIFNYPAEFLAKAQTQEYYMRKILHGQLRFPDLYVVFSASQEQLSKRREADPTRTRRNFVKHLRMIKPQRKYFQFLKNHTEISVEFVELHDVEQAMKEVIRLVAHHRPKHRNDLKEFKKILWWLDNTHPDS